MPGLRAEVRPGNLEPGDHHPDMPERAHVEAAVVNDPCTAIRLLERALHLHQNGERAPGGSETWAGWVRDAEAFLRDAGRRRLMDRLWLARCELGRDVVAGMDDEALAAHLNDAHPGNGQGPGLLLD